MKIDELKTQARNVNKHTQRGQGLLRNSIGQNGIGDGITIAANDEAISGSMRLETLYEIMPDVKVQVIETRGDTILVNKRMDIATPETKIGRALSVASNAVAAADWSPDGDILQAWAAEDENIKRLFADDEWQEITGDEKPAMDADTEEASEVELLRVPDAIWGTDNDFGIPMLDLSRQANCLETPFAGWGTMPRKDKMTGTYHFYVEDYRFENVWRNPLDIANSNCASVVEPNFSVYDDMPRAVALWQVYRKRWIARWLQSVGITVFVDLNISERHADLRLLGVPTGWKAYATRSYVDRLGATEREYQSALAHSGAESILFVVYGGGKCAEKLSRQYGWIWYPDQQTKDTGGKNG